MEEKKPVSLGGSIVAAFFADYTKIAGNIYGKAKEKMKGAVASINKDLEIMELDAESIKKVAREIKDQIAGIVNEKTQQGIEFLIVHLSRDAKFKIMKNLSEDELEKLASLSDELNNEVKYFNFWISREKLLICPKPKTFGELKSLCEKIGVKLEKEFVPCATVMSLQTKSDYVNFYLECGDFRRGPRIASVSVAFLYGK